MSAYLQNLVAKNLRLAEVIQPRLPSLFEPEPRSIQLAIGRPNYDALKEEAGFSTASDFQDNAGIKSGRYPAILAPDLGSPGHSIPGKPATPGIARGESQESKRPPQSGDHELPVSDIDREWTAPVRIETEATPLPDLSASFQAQVPHRNALGPSKDRKEIKRIGSEDSMSKEVFAPFLIIDDSAAPGPSAKETEGSPWPHIPNDGDSPAPGAKTETAEGLTGRQRTMPDADATLLPVGELEKRSPPGQGIKHEISDKVPGQQSQKIRSSSERTGLGKAGSGSAVVQPSVRSYIGKTSARGERMAKAETKPEVQVTIGRIEVRATPAAATKQRKRDYPPEMSLNEYLKIKRGGS